MFATADVRESSLRKLPVSRRCGKKDVLYTSAQYSIYEALSTVEEGGVESFETAQSLRNIIE